jgi:hypothetical protein
VLGENGNKSVSGGSHVRSIRGQAEEEPEASEVKRIRSSA